MQRAGDEVVSKLASPDPAMCISSWRYKKMKIYLRVGDLNSRYEKSTGFAYSWSTA